MDVDLLRPGTVPMSPDTSLWFEFLLQPSHLEKHFQNPHADPTPTELITKVLTLATYEKPQNGDVIVLTGQTPKLKRCEALKILACKVAAYLRWDLQVLEKSLTMSMLMTLLKSFLAIVDPSLADIKSHKYLKLSDYPPHALFAIFLYHRWVLRSNVNLPLYGKTKQALEPPAEEVLDMEAENSADLLRKMAGLGLSMLVPRLSCFAIPTPFTESEHQWDDGELLDKRKVSSEILIELSMYLIKCGKYPEARTALSECLEVGVDLANVYSGLSIAVGIRPKHYKPTLPQQFHESIAAKFINIDKVLEKDNLAREVPIVYRQSLELDISSEVANGTLITSRDVVAMIRAMNTVRAALDGGVQLHGRLLSPTALIKAISNILPLGDRDKKKMEYYLLQLLATSDTHSMRQLATHISKLPLLTQEQISAFTDEDFDTVDRPDDPSIESKCQNLAIASLERLMLSSYNAAEIKTALTKLFTFKPLTTWEKLNRNWDVPVQISSALNSLPTPFMRNYIYILIAKSYELVEMKAYSKAELLLEKALEELGNDPAYEKLISFELLYINIKHFHHMWPAKQLNWSDLTDKCLEALSTARVTVREAATLYLLNTGSWSPLANFNQPNKTLMIELYTAYARASVAISQFNGKVTTEAWDKTTPLFIINKNRRDTRILKGLCEILEPNCLSLVISLLVRLHNILKDQVSMEINMQLLQTVWPATIKNSSQYSIKQVCETLLEVLEHSLTYYPYNISWLKVLGDLHFVNGHYRHALASYLEAAAVGTEHFSRPLHRNVLEDSVIKRMIKSCSQLQCHTQAALLCQLLEETDYTTAFKSLAESSPSDASDSYHQCIWDINLLEYLISLHAKRGEHHRKQALVRIIGLLELNANNNDEIKREAENIRKGLFLRAMAAQYL